MTDQDATPETLRLLKNGDNEFDAEIDAAADAWQLLIDAVNESDEPCLPECDSIAHAEGCPHIDRAAWMAKQQATIVDLRKRLEAAEKDRRNVIERKHIDATPDAGYPLRILRAYRQHAECDWAESTDGSVPTNPLLLMMNETNRRRREVLDAAIRKLEAAEKIQEKVGPSDAPCHYGNEDAFAWVAGWNSARDAFRAALAGEEKP